MFVKFISSLAVFCAECIGILVVTEEYKKTKKKRYAACCALFILGTIVTTIVSFNILK